MRPDLFDAARSIRERAHAPYSRYLVGAVLVTEAGSVHAGCNVENGAFPEGWCAETSAIAHMVAASLPGPGRRIAEICTASSAPCVARTIAAERSLRQRRIAGATGFRAGASVARSIPLSVSAVIAARRQDRPRSAERIC